MASLIEQQQQEMSKNYTQLTSFVVFVIFEWSKDRLTQNCNSVTKYFPKKQL